MRRPRVLATVLVAFGCALVQAAVAHAAEPLADVSVTVDREQISTDLGQKVAFRSTIANRGSRPTSGLVAHLNILSLRDGLYVDPEDWSSNRTRYLAPIPAGASTTIRWRMQAVSAGSLAAYVSVVGDERTARRPVSGPVVRMAVAQRRTLNTGGILPLALGMPALLGGLSLALMFRRRG